MTIVMTSNGKLFKVIKNLSDFKHGEKIYRCSKRSNGSIEIVNGWSDTSLNIIYDEIKSKNQHMLVFQCFYDDRGIGFLHYLEKNHPYLSKESSVRLGYYIDSIPYDSSQEPEDDCL